MSSKKYFFISILIVTFAIAGCKKDTLAPAPAAANGYGGGFVFTNHYTSLINNVSSDSTYTYTGTVQVISTNSQDGSVTVKINYSIGNTIQAVVQSNGSFVPQTWNHGGLSGSYSDYNNFQMVISGGGMAGTWHDNITAVR